MHDLLSKLWCPVRLITEETEQGLKDVILPSAAGFHWDYLGATEKECKLTRYESTTVSAAEEMFGWWMVKLAVTYWGFVMKDCPATSVAPAAMQFLAVAGEVTVWIPLAFDSAAPSFPAASTGIKSCQSNGLAYKPQIHLLPLYLWNG